MISHLLIAGNRLFSQIRCKVKTFSTISSINSQKLLLFAANLSFLLTFLQEYAENWRKIVAQLFLPYNIIHKLIISILQPCWNIFPIFHKAFNMKLQTFLCFFLQSIKVWCCKNHRTGTLLPREPP